MSRSNRIRRLLTYLLLFALPFIPHVSTGQIDSGIVVKIEEAAPGTTYSGVSNLRGWAVGPNGIERVDLFVDGEFATSIPYGGSRGDVGNAFPEFPDSDMSGFSMAFNYSNLQEGVHTFTVVAIGKSGSGSETASSTYTVTRFENPFIRDPDTISLSEALITDDGDKTILIENFEADGIRYDVELQWRTATQGFAIVDIEDLSAPARAFWGVSSDICCPTSMATTSLTIDGVTRRSVTPACDSPGESSFEGFVTTTTGPKDYSLTVSAPTCPTLETDSTVTFESETCYLFVSALDGVMVAEAAAPCPPPPSARLRRSANAFEPERILDGWDVGTPMIEGYEAIE